MGTCEGVGRQRLSRRQVMAWQRSPNQGTVRRSLWQQADFVKLWAGESISLVGSEVSALALPLTAVLVLHTPPLQVSLVAGVAWLPYLCSLFAGVWIDRVRRRPLLLTANVGRALLMGVIPLAFLGHWLSLALLVGVALGTGLLTVLFNLSYGSYLTTLVPRADLLAGNSALQASASLAKVSGPSIAGMLVQLVSAPMTLVVDVVSFVVATGSLLTIRARETPLPPTHMHPPFWSALRFGVRVTLRQPLMRAMASMACVYNLCEEGVLTLWLSYGPHDLHLAPAAMGAIMAVGSMGAVAGSFSAGHLAQRLGIGYAWLVMIAASGGGLVVIAVAGGPCWVLLLIAGFAINGWGITAVNVYIKTLRAMYVPPALSGRVMASYAVFGLGVVPIGAALGGVLQVWLGMHLTMLVIALGSLVATACVWPVRWSHRTTWIGDDVDAGADTADPEAAAA